jgi:hypothetical protein
MNFNRTFILTCMGIASVIAALWLTNGAVTAQGSDVG